VGFSCRPFFVPACFCVLYIMPSFHLQKEVRDATSERHIAKARG
jgi:hypothetical protein